MSPKKTPTREKILETTIDIINKEGIQGITTRKISKEAGVNVAAVNYHFRSKNALVSEALARTLEELMKMPAESLDREDLPPYQRLLDFFHTFMKGAVAWPGITKAHIYETLMENNYQTQFVKRFNDFLTELMSRMKGVRFRGEAKDPRLVFIQVLSAAILPVLMPRLFHAFAKTDFKDSGLRKAYAADLLSRYFE